MDKVLTMVERFAYFLFSHEFMKRFCCIGKVFQVFFFSSSRFSIYYFLPAGNMHYVYMLLII